MRARHRHERTAPKARWRTLPSPTAQCRELTRPPDANLDSAPPLTRARSPESNADVMRITRMRGAARCDLFSVRVDPFFLVSFVRPTRQMSRAPQRHDCTRQLARRLHLDVGWQRRSGTLGFGLFCSGAYTVSPRERRCSWIVGVHDCPRHSNQARGGITSECSSHRRFEVSTLSSYAR